MTALIADAPYAEHTYSAQDGLQLYYRDYGDRAGTRLPVLCLPGLTRNSKDFHEIASHIAATRRVVCPDLRGRGRSAYDPNYKNYQIATELNDVFALMAAAGLPKAVVIGTSRGGLISAVMSIARPTALAGVILNDIGPDVAPQGIARILGYVGKIPEPTTWEDAVAAVRRVNEPMFELSDAEWMSFARQTFRDDNGRPRVDYDAGIGKAIAEPPPAPIDPWPIFDGFTKIPLLVIRGANSDLLAPETVAKMKARKPDIESVDVPKRGHAPLLNEPVAVAAIDRFLARFD